MISIWHASAGLPDAKHFSIVFFAKSSNSEHESVEMHFRVAISHSLRHEFTRKYHTITMTMTTNTANVHAQCIAVVASYILWQKIAYRTHSYYYAFAVFLVIPFF